MSNRQRWQLHEKTRSTENRGRTLPKKKEPCKKHNQAPLTENLGLGKKEEGSRIKEEEGRRKEEVSFRKEKESRGTSKVRGKGRPKVKTTKN